MYDRQILNYTNNNASGMTRDLDTGATKYTL
jgi:hypothetical protein